MAYSGTVIYCDTDPAEVTGSETEYELTGLDFGADLSLAASN